MSTPDFSALMMDSLGGTGPTDLPEEPTDASTTGDDGLEPDADAGDGADPGDGGAGAALETPPSGEADGEAGGTEGEDDAAAEAEGRVRGPDGKFVKKEAATPELDADGKPVVKAPIVPAKPAKAADAINDAIPADLKPATKERITKLVATAKDLTTKLETVTNEQHMLLQTVADTGMNGQEFGEFLSVVGDARSGDPTRMQTAFDYLKGVVTNVAKQLGITAPGADPLEGADDLKQRVNAGTLTVKDATELASARRVAAATTLRTQQEQQRAQRQSQQTEAQKTARAGEVASLREQEATLKDSDPNFAAKKTKLMADPAFLQQLKAAPAGQLVATFNKAYRAATVAPARAATPAAARGAQPLRGNKAPSGAAPTPKAKTVDAAIMNIDFSKV